MVYNKILPIFSAATAGLMMASFATPVSALTYSSDVGVKFTFNSSLQINVSTDLVISNLSPGTDSDSNTIDVTILTNNATGYTLNATVGNNTTYNTRNLVHNLSGSSANFASINYGSSMASLSTDNTWGYSYSTNNGSTWSNYDGLPLYSDATNIATLKTATGPASTNAGDKVNFKIAAKAATSQYSGEYNNVINFVATANPVPTLGPVACTSGKICYNDNSLEEAIGTMGQQTASASTEVTLFASNFSREGYGFAGWSDSYDYASNSNAQLYGPQEDITTPSDMSEGLSLYAIWIPSAGSIQSNATTICNSLTTATGGLKSLNSVSALTDQRDGQTYAVAKLADGNCWMIENLRLESTASHNSDGTLAQGYGISSTYGNFEGLPAAENIVFPDDATANSLYYSGAQEGTATINIGNSDWEEYRFPRYNNLHTNYRSSNPTGAPSDYIYSYGNYYTWAAAMANTIYYVGPNSQDANGKTSENVNTSICPLGWKLPYGRDTGNGSTPGGLAYLDTHLGGNGANSGSSTTPNGTIMSKTWRSFPNNYIYSGYFSESSITETTRNGIYWSSTSGSYDVSYWFSINSTNVLVKTLGDKDEGASIRCVASS